jgi:hypothetical protein
VTHKGASDQLDFYAQRFVFAVVAVAIEILDIYAALALLFWPRRPIDIVS